MYFLKKNVVRETKWMLELLLYNEVLFGCMIVYVLRLVKMFWVKLLKTVEIAINETEVPVKITGDTVSDGKRVLWFS